MKIIEINLLPPDKVPESPYSIYNIAILVISLVIATWLIFLSLQVNNLKNQYIQRKETLMQKLALYRGKKEKIDHLQQKKTELEQRYELITNALGQRITWHDKLNDIHRQIPENVWLAQILIEVQKSEELQKGIQKMLPQSKKTSAPQDLDENGQPLILLHILGYAKELPQVGELISNLDSSQFFEKTKFETIDKTEINTRSAIVFEITSQVNSAL
jgi:Tfp pilus assembly protein PilN